MTEKYSIKKLETLYSKGKMTPKLKTATKDLIDALKSFKMQEISELAYLHQKISGVVEEGEDDDYNKKVVGTTLYQQFDYISHSSSGEIYNYVKGAK